MKEIVLQYVITLSLAAMFFLSILKFAKRLTKDLNSHSLD